jgi:hypothetical protein
MPLPLAPVALFALRAGAVAAVAWGAARLARGAVATGRTDQRAEDALDDLDEGLAAHVPADRPGQRQASLRLRRSIGWGARMVEIDLGVIARLRLRRVRAETADQNL